MPQEASGILPTHTNVCVDVDTRVHTKSSLSVFTTLGSPLDQSGRAKFTTSGAHDVIAITSLPKNDLCTEELRDIARLKRGQSNT